MIPGAARPITRGAWPLLSHYNLPRFLGVLVVTSQTAASMEKDDNWQGGSWAKRSPVQGLRWRACGEPRLSAPPSLRGRKLMGG